MHVNKWSIISDKISNHYFRYTEFIEMQLLVCQKSMINYIWQDKNRSQQVVIILNWLEFVKMQLSFCWKKWSIIFLLQGKLNSLKCNQCFVDLDWSLNQVFWQADCIEIQLLIIFDKAIYVSTDKCVLFGTTQMLD